MITIEKLNIYKKYSGNIENWDRFGKKKDQKKLEYEEWLIIDEIIDNLYLINKGLASASFKNKTESKLKDLCDNEETQKTLRSLVGKYSK